MKKNNLPLVKSILLEAVKTAGLELSDGQLHLEKTKTLEHGHFSSNIAMLLAGQLKKSPREVAQAILDKLDSDLIEKVEIAGPGFINLWIEQKFYTTEAKMLLADFDHYLKNSLQSGPQKTMVTDTSHPNVAKPMGIHHLLSTIIGDSVIKIYRRLGWKVISDNYIGDWGTQFGKLIYAIKTWGDKNKIEADPIPELLKLYVHFHNEAEANPTLEDFGRAEFKKLEDGDAENRALLDYIVKISLREFERIYYRLDVHYDLMNGESFYEDKMAELLEEGRKKGVFVDGQDGAWIVPSDDPNDPPAIVKKSDGATIYLTRDLAQTAYWEKEYHPDVMLWVVDVAQSLHFKQRFEVSRKLGQTSAHMIHAAFGRMQFKDMAMSTRKGNILKLEEVLDEAEQRAAAKVEEKSTDLSTDEKVELAKIMGINSIKYNILSQNRTTNITFEWDKMLSFEGNSAPYLMYTVARAKSILRKADFQLADCQKFELNLQENIEKKLMIQLLMYPDAVQRAAEDFKPNHIANFLYELASDFNSFYNGNSILQAESDALKNSRLLLTAAVTRVMEDGFALLGLKAPERM